MHEQGNCGRLRYELTQQLQPLRAQHTGKKGHARNIATRLIKTSHQALSDRIAPTGKNDWDRRGCGFGRDRRRIVSKDDGRRPPDQIRRQSGQSVILTLR